MRTIKFRGKNISTGEWRYGCLVRYSDHSCYIFGDYVDKNEVWEVLTETVGQFTGLLDKNGNEIYEGDVLYYPMQGKRVVYYPFNERVASYGLREISTGMCSTLQDSHRVYEIIGNLYQNPELLEGVK